MKVTLMRLDTRLVHGQVCMKWSKESNAKNLFVVDKLVAGDTMMAKFFRGAAPKSIELLEIYSPESFMEAYKNGALAEGNAFVLFRDVQNCYDLFKLGFPVEAVNIGNQAMKPGKKSVLREVFLSPDEYDKLKEMHDAGVEVYIQIIPEQAKVDFKTITAKMKK